MGKRYRDRDWLEVMYHGRELTQREIAETCGVSPRTIRNWMNEHGIPTRDVEGRHHGMHGRERSDEEKEQIAESLRGREYDDEWRERLAEAKSGEEIPEAVREKISESLKGTTKSDETRRKMSESSRGDENANWQGGHVQDYGIGWRPARRAVRARDVVCRQCGHDGSEDRLEVHHLLPVRAFIVTVVTVYQFDRTTECGRSGNDLRQSLSGMQRAPTSRTHTISATWCCCASRATWKPNTTGWRSSPD